jgi:hypothetical protein
MKLLLCLTLALLLGGCVIEGPGDWGWHHHHHH